jgi:hypothetical protein
MRPIMVLFMAALFPSLAAAQSGAGKAGEVKPLPGNGPPLEVGGKEGGRPASFRRIVKEGRIFRRVVKEGKVTFVLEGENQFQQQQQQQQRQRPKTYPGGRGGRIRALAEGDPFAWTALLGTLAVIGLAFLIGQVYQLPLKKPATPGQPDAAIIAAWKQQSGNAFMAAIALIPLILVAVGVGIVLQDPYLMMFILWPMLLFPLIICMVNWRCPACGRKMGREWHPKFCANCGVHLQETEPAMSSHSEPIPNAVDPSPEFAGANVLAGPAVAEPAVCSICGTPLGRTETGLCAGCQRRAGS